MLDEALELVQLDVDVLNFLGEQLKVFSFLLRVRDHLYELFNELLDVLFLVVLLYVGLLLLLDFLGCFEAKRRADCLEHLILQSGYVVKELGRPKLPHHGPTNVLVESFLGQIDELQFGALLNRMRFVWLFSHVSLSGFICFSQTAEKCGKGVGLH